jgi:Pentatricopeptide repeat domain
VSILLSMLTKTGKLKEARSVFVNSKNKSSWHFHVIAKALGSVDQAEEATALLHEYFKIFCERPTLLSDIIVVLNCWVDSSREDRVQQAFKVFRMVQDTKLTRDISIQPDLLVSYYVMLKCLATSQQSDAGQQIEDLLDEMRENHLEPNSFCFYFAIKGCLRCDDTDRADRIMGQMENSRYPPNIFTFNTIVAYWAGKGTRAAAERTEQIVSYMKQLSLSRPKLTPDHVSMTAILQAWMVAGESDSRDRMWLIYNQMQNDRIPLHFTTGRTIIPFFASSTDALWIQRSDDVLRLIEMPGSVCPPQEDFYDILVNGWISVGNIDQAMQVFFRRIENYATCKNFYVAPRAGNMHHLTNALLTMKHVAAATAFVENMQQMYEGKHLPKGPHKGTIQMLLEAWKDSPPSSEWATMVAKLEKIHRDCKTREKTSRRTGNL